MITGLHALIYSDDAPATRAFFRDVLGMGGIEHGEGSGWLIFGTGPSELGVHPTSENGKPISMSLPVTTRSRSSPTTSPPRSETWKPKAPSSPRRSSKRYSA